MSQRRHGHVWTKRRCEYERHEATDNQRDTAFVLLLDCIHLHDTLLPCATVLIKAGPDCRLFAVPKSLPSYIMPIPRQIRRCSDGGKKAAKKAAGMFVLIAIEIKQVDWSVAYSIIKGMLDTVVQVTPAAAPAVAVIDQIVQLAQQVSTNRRAVSALVDRCRDLEKALETAEQQKLSRRLRQAFASSRTVLAGVLGRMTGWATLNVVKAFIQQDTITKDIQQSHTDVLSCIEKFHLVFNLDMHQMQEEFKQQQEQDTREIMEKLASIEEGTGMVMDIVQETRSDVRQVASMMQDGLKLYSESDPRRQVLAKNLHLVLEEAGELLPDMSLDHGEVALTLGSEVMAPKTGRMHVYQLGTYLSSQQVLVKRIGNEMQDEIIARNRFRREAAVWLRVWKQDRGRYTVPMYGFWVTPVDKYLYLVSSYYPNGTADQWVKKYPNVNHIAILRDAARGLSVLHSLRIFHGDFRGASIVIGPDGNGLLSDFALSKPLDDCQTSIPMSLVDVESMRWQAPETITDWQLSMASDIWGFGMTVYELLTHQRPFFDREKDWKGYKGIAALVVDKGTRPTRLLDEDVVNRGLDDEVWNFILNRCWQLHEADRVLIGEVVEFFNDPKRVA
ncbi:kinase-like protein [Neolentinus lepideus HHB14362 ss-1]|uniref:Kinase-like protein n=1 Tax=Neolentinus lepideus HHB14362 ss-1 TaxID=1314782 RepID=A0A165TSW3_9AGAM|nr:kinase-like protein [Neolentinus lepideus HHB14362 ss-1]